jgi:hypothetical protein
VHYQEKTKKGQSYKNKEGIEVKQDFPGKRREKIPIKAFFVLLK